MHETIQDFCHNAPFELSKGSALKARQIASDIDKLAGQSRDHASRTAELMGVDDFDAKSQAAAAKLREQERNLLGQTVALRERIGEFYDDVENLDRQEAATSVQASLEDARHNVRQQLVDIGFADEPRLNGIVAHHPDVRDLLASVASVQSFSLAENRAANEAAMERIRERLADAKQRAMSLAV